MKRALAALLVLAAGGAWLATRRAPPAGGSGAAAPATPAEIAAELGAGRRPAAAPPAPEVPPDAPPQAAADASARRAALELNDQALVALEEGRLEDAVALLESCLAIAPEEPVFRRNLAETLARRARREYERADAGAVARAVLELERALELAPERQDLAPLLARWRRVAETERGFWVDASDHFELAYDGSRDELLWSWDDILAPLERAYQDFGELFGRYPVERGRARIRVVLYRRAEFDGVTGIGHWAGGVFDGTVRVPVEDLGREREVLARVLRHELAHAFTRDVGGACVPGWLDEGLAQWLESDDPRYRDARLAAARARLAAHDLFPLERLREGIARWSDAAAIARAYDQSLAFLARLVHDHGERLPYDLIAACPTPVDDTFRQRTGSDLAAALDTLRQDLQRTKPTSATSGD